ncbi:MAG TPA: PstS family phosphate ABC transporter substrate-binding protein [Candidatus Limnocylindrales bacterium]|nr:PstS family phosphate ABC transporter substrate-binding protein [Candidatus Limnocylindrales bacterium]
MDKMRTRMALAGAAALLVAAACGGGPTASPGQTPPGQTPGTGTPGNGGDLSGSIRLDGSSTVGPLSEVAAELYEERQPNVTVSVAQSGTGGGFQKFCTGETDMNNASRPIKDSEIETCEQSEIGYDAIQVANDALSLLVNNDNPVQCMTVEQARQVWDLDATVATWGEIEGLDVPAEFADTPINLYGPGTDSGTFDFFTEEINGEAGRININYTDIGEDDHQAVLGVQGDIGAMGYVPYSYYQEVLGDVRALAIDDGNGCVEATLENVQDGSYTPLGRPLFVYASDTSLARPEVLDFMRFYIDNAVEIADTAGFVPLTDEQVDEQREKIEQLAGGS